MTKHRTLRSAVLSVAIVAAMLATLIPGAASATARSSVKKKHLSLTNVAILGEYSLDSGLMYIANALGYYKQQGLNVTYSTTNLGSASALTTAFLSGAYQFQEEPMSSAALAVQSGAGIRAVASIDTSLQQEIVINSTVAATLHIPTAGNTPAEALKQFLALKGSHLVDADIETTSPGLVDLLAACKLHGLTCGVNAPSDDINLDLAGNGSAEVALFGAGKVQALNNQPPLSVQPNSVVINIGLITPISTAISFGLITSPQMIKQHPDTVQAVVNAVTEAWEYAKEHPQGAARIVAKLFALDGITSPDEDLYLYQDDSSHWRTPLLVKAAFNNLKNNINNAGTLGNITITYSDLMDPVFAQRAVKKYAPNAPTTV